MYLPYGEDLINAPQRTKSPIKGINEQSLSKSISNDNKQSDSEQQVYGGLPPESSLFSRKKFSL
jgi:hypothetical protein